jgi:phosphoribosylaminoimidazole-succinocarboxamide synthase
VRTNEKMDKDRFRQDLGKVEEAYREVAQRLGILPESVAPETKPSNVTPLEKKQ